MCTKDAIFTGFIGGLFGSLGVYLMTLLRESYYIWRDKKRVYRYILGAIKPFTNHEWRSSKTIASYTNLPKERVNYICSIHPKIVLSTSEKEDMWGIKGLSRSSDD